MRRPAHPVTQHSSRRTLRNVGVLLTLALLLCAVLAWAAMQGRPVALPDVAGARLPCVSYAPFRRPGHTPFDPALRIGPADIEADLRQLKTVTSCVRTYGLDHGLDAVPQVARALGMQVVLGAWIGRDMVVNAQQLERALALSRDYADVVKLLVVGNEVLLRRELTPEALATLLAHAKRHAVVPVAYADVWEFWQRHAAVLRPHVHVIAAHVLPYWEDQPVAAHHAVAHVQAIAAQLKTMFAPQPVFIAETGWPAAGRQRGPAVPGAVQQAQFARELLAHQTATNPLDFNWIEGFDQPWKRALEGAMGGYWGIFAADGTQRLRLHASTVADPEWWRVPIGAAAGAIAALLWAAGSWQQRRIRAAGATALVLTCSLLGAVLMQQVQLFMQWNRGPSAWWWGGGLAAAATVCTLAAVARLAQRLDWLDADPDGAALQPGAAQALVALARQRTATASDGAIAAPAIVHRAEPLLAISRLVVLFGAACIMLGLIVDARYRALTWPVLLAPAVVLMLLAMLGDRTQGVASMRADKPALAITQPREEHLLAWVLLGTSLALVGLEGVMNAQAWGLALMAAALATVVLWPTHRSPPSTRLGASRLDAGLASTNAASNTAGAPRSTV